MHDRRKTGYGTEEPLYHWFKAANNDASATMWTLHSSQAHEFL
jgi:hypothetical protein